MEAVLPDHLTPLVGEFAWHTLVVDPRIAAESLRHFNLVKSTLDQHSVYTGESLHILELACYAHTTGYDLARELGAQVTLFELSRHTLSKGRELAGRGETQINPRLVVGDFHQLPFEDDSFNYVFICSALHHTWRFERVLEEMMRVLAPGGLVFLENEPTHRGFCFYKFRCNRPHEFTPFEYELEKLGIIRTIAEPYLGSRPESLFGMIENQNMPLGQIVTTIGNACDLVGLGLFPETVMGKLEHRWLQNRFAGAAMLKKDIIENLQERIVEAKKYYTEAEAGMGFSLPAEDEVAAMADGVSQAIAGLQGNPNTLGFRMGLSEIFGAPLQLIARKRDGRQCDPNSPRILDKPMAEKEITVRFPASHFQDKAAAFNQRHNMEKDIYNGFSPLVRKVLTQKSLIPELVHDQLSGLQEIFSEQAWCLTEGEYDLIAMENISHHLISITNRQNKTQLQLPMSHAAGDQFVLLLRIHCELEDKDYFNLKLQCGDRVLDGHAVYKTESILCQSVLSRQEIEQAEQAIQLTLTGIRQVGNGRDRPLLYRIAISYAGLFEMKAENFSQTEQQETVFEESVHDKDDVRNYYA
ncbi:class I SAM-dependent methyltransferase [bacterium]|nr:class I SAM-dependent methyltransferase [bacterium]